MNATPFKDSLTGSIRYWERGRIAYNAALLAVVAAIFVADWPLSRSTVSVDLALTLFALAVLANVCYCAAYPVDLLVRHSGYRGAWEKGRWVLLLVGTAFACVISQFAARVLFIGAL